jgi:DNA-binding NarL/FixJ family response regulator
VTDQARPDQWMASRFRVLVVSGRTTVQALFADIARQSRGAVGLIVLAMDARAVAEASDALASASVVVVDASIDRAEAVAVCEAVRADEPRVPISAVFCCPHSAAAADLRGLLAAGVGGLVDLQLAADETLRVLQGIARGQGAFHLQMAAGSNTSLLELLARERATDALSDHDRGLLRLVALGLTDHEIGRQLYLSHHTVKHRIDRLRRRVHARNRIQLAAWAGSQDALRVEGGGAPDSDADAPEVSPVARVPGQGPGVDGRDALHRPG